MTDTKVVPGAWEIQQLVSGQITPEAVSKSLHAALLSTNPHVVDKAVQTLEIAESYSNQRRVQTSAFANTGYYVQTWPGLDIQLTDADVQQITENVKRQDGGLDALQTLAMLCREGIVKTSRISPFGELDPKAIKHLPGSRGTPTPRGDAHTHEQAWANNLRAARMIQQVVRDVAAYNTAKTRGLEAEGLEQACPFNRGNHAKGIAFEKVAFQVDAGAPEWVQDLMSKPGLGRMRISGSQTDPFEPDSEPHQTGIRLSIPFGGSLDDPRTPRLELTANTGARTHAESGLDHVSFTQHYSVPVDGLWGTRLGRIAKHFIDGGEVLERAREIKTALDATKQAAEESFHEHVFFARHAFFVGGRHVQVRFEVLAPRSFRKTQGDSDPNADLNEVKRTVSLEGLKLAMYLGEIPEGSPELIEQEAWADVPWHRAATIEVPPQNASADSTAAQWFDQVPHVPAGANKLFQAEGIGRDRVAVYTASGQMRAEWKPGDGLDKWQGYDPKRQRPREW
jgi:hypothetical protein